VVGFFFGSTFRFGGCFFFSIQEEEQRRYLKPGIKIFYFKK
jgi:hypothetical protein